MTDTFYRSMVVQLLCDKTYKHDTKFESLGETSRNEYVSDIPCVVHVNVYNICVEAIFVCDITLVLQQ